MYTVPNETFTRVHAPGGAATTEWLSASPSLAPIAKARVSLEQVMEEGCQVLFLKEGMGWDDFIRTVYAPHQQEFDAGPKQLALYKRLIAEGTLRNENVLQKKGDPLGLGQWATVGRNHQGRRGVGIAITD